MVSESVRLTSNLLDKLILAAKKFANSGAFIEESKRDPGTYDQPQQGKLLASLMIEAHKQQLQRILLKTEFQVGKFNRKSNSTLFDLLQYAVANPEHSCDAIFHFRRELNLVNE